MTTNHTNKGNTKGGAQDQRSLENDKRDSGSSEQAENDKKHVQQRERQPRAAVGVSKLPASETAGK